MLSARPIPSPEVLTSVISIVYIFPFKTISFSPFHLDLSFSSFSLSAAQRVYFLSHIRRNRAETASYEPNLRMIPAPQNSLYPTLSRTAERTAFCMFFILLLFGYTRLIHYTQKDLLLLFLCRRPRFTTLFIPQIFSSNYSRNLQLCPAKSGKISQPRRFPFFRKNNRADHMRRNRLQRLFQQFLIFRLILNQLST